MTSTTTLSPFVWNDSFSVGVREIDSQHQRLVALVNRLQEAMAQGKGKDVMGGIIAELIQYTTAHFAYEERMMKWAAYPDYDVHKLQHDRLAARVLEFHKEFTAGRVLMSIDVMEFLKNWLQSHIKGADKIYSPFLNAKGIR